jgi:hypothetical protein
MRPLVALLVLLISMPSFSAVILEEGKTKSKKSKILPKTASDGVSLRAIRRVGVGASAQGPLGMFGINMEFNFKPTWSMLTGFGGGTGYQAFTLQAKRALYGEWMVPYISLGYARWYSVKEGPLPKTNPPFLSERFITPEQRASGIFDEHLFYPAFGLQYFQLNGDWAGFSMFAEALLLVDLEDFIPAPTGTLGMIYYF